MEALMSFIFIIWLFAGITIPKAVAVVVAWVRATSDDWVITTWPTFFTLSPSVVPVVFAIVPALIGPENVVDAIFISS